MTGLEERRARYATEVADRYRQRYPASEEMFRRGRALFPNGVAQYGRMVHPFPPFFEEAGGATLHSIDGTELTDFWAGHFCMLFGHEPSSLTSRVPLHRQLGVHTVLEAEVAEMILAVTGDEQVLFSTTGTLATMHATMIACAATGRSKVLKMEGGWHGVQPWAMSGVCAPTSANHLAKPESGGIPGWFDENVLVIPFNDVEAAEAAFAEHGDQLAACILELVMGNAGMVMANPEFASTVRRLCTKHGVALVIDEIVTGFRVRLGGLQELYGIRGDLSTYGKSISGGMPFACIVGSRRLMSAVRVGEATRRVVADSGTFTAHPGVLYEVRETLRRLIEAGDVLYERILGQAQAVKSSLMQVFASRLLAIEVTGASTLAALPTFPIGTLRFTLDEERARSLPPGPAHWDNVATDVAFRDNTARLALILQGLFTWQGFGAITAAHDGVDLDGIIEAYDRFADEIKDLFPVDGTR